MRLTLCSEVVAERGFTGACDLAASLGYDGVELAPNTLGAEPHRIASAEVAWLRRAASDAGAPVTGLHWLLLAPAGLSITSADPETRRRTLDVGRRYVALCAELGGGYIVHGSPAQRALAPGAEAEGRAVARDYMHAMAEAAKAAGIIYCLEPLSPKMTGYVTSIAEAAAIVREIGSTHFRTMIDAYAASSGEAEAIPDLIRRWMPTGLLAHVHFNDPGRKGPGQGELDFAPIVAALEAEGYDGWIGVEPFDHVPDGPTCAARAVGYLRGIEAGRGNARV